MMRREDEESTGGRGRYRAVDWGFQDATRRMRAARGGQVRQVEEHDERVTVRPLGTS
jgi:hypothetical protein